MIVPMEEVGGRSIFHFYPSDRPHWFLLDGHEVVGTNDVMAWGKMLEDLEARRVGETYVRGVRISTVFLGMDHSFGTGGPPIVFETMIFGGALDHEQWRYATWSEAEAGHALAVEKVKAAMEAK